jgi:hypothetical protein
MRIFPSQIPGQKDSGIRIKKFKYFNAENCFQPLGNVMQIFIPDTVLDFLTILDPGSSGQKGPGFGMRIRNTVWNNDRQAKFQQPWLPGSGSSSPKSMRIRICNTSETIPKFFLTLVSLVRILSRAKCFFGETICKFFFNLSFFLVLSKRVSSVSKDFPNLQI